VADKVLIGEAPFDGSDGSWEFIVNLGNIVDRSFFISSDGEWNAILSMPQGSASSFVFRARLFSA